jgi:hypothetical protein
VAPSPAMHCMGHGCRLENIICFDVPAFMQCLYNVDGGYVVVIHMIVTAPPIHLVSEMVCHLITSSGSDLGWNHLRSSRTSLMPPHDAT